MNAIVDQQKESAQTNEQRKANDDFTLLGVLADIRKKTGVGDKVMLSELADTLAALIQNGDSAIDTNKHLQAALSTQAELLKASSDWLTIALAYMPDGKSRAEMEAFMEQLQAQGA